MPVYKLRDLVSHRPYLILPGESIVGRNDEAHIKLPDVSISRRHARIINADEGLWIEDMGSSNGTYVRGERISESKALQEGEEIRLGNLIFRIDPEVATQAPEADIPPAPAISWEKFQRKTSRLSEEILRQAVTPLPEPKDANVAEKTSNEPVVALPEVVNEVSRFKALDDVDNFPNSLKEKGGASWKASLVLAFGAGIAVGLLLGFLAGKLT